MRNLCIVFVSLLFGFAQAAEPIPVSTVALNDVTSAPVFSVPAEVIAVNRPQLAAEVSGQISRLLVQVGDRVQPGDLLVELDCRLYQARIQAVLAAISRAKAQSTFAQTQWNRARDLKRKGSVSKELLEQRRLAVKTARADLQAQQAQQQLTDLDVQRCQIKAPFAGLVSQRLASVGSFATPGMPLVELIALDTLEIKADLRATDVAGLTDAQQVQFSYQDQPFPVQLRTLLPLVNQRTLTREARLTVLEPQGVSIGAAGRLSWQGAQQLLPAHYMVRREGQLGIFVAQATQAAFIPLAQAREGQPVVVDLPPDTLLITEGRQRLQDGDTMTVNP